MHIKTIFTFFLLTNFIFLHGQDYVWERTIYDGSGQPLFTGGYLSRSLVNFVDIDGDEDEDIFFLAGNDYDFYYLHFFKNTGTNKNPKYNFVTDKYSPYNYHYGYYSNGYPPMTTFADIDADEDYDLFIAYGKDLRLYENTGNKTNPVFDWDSFEIVLTIETDYCNYPAFVDIDADLDLDLFITDEDAKICFYRNIGDEYNYNFNLEISDLLPDHKPYGNMAFTDIDDDNDYDLFYNCAVQSFVNNIFYFENVGDSTNFDFQLADDHYFTFNFWQESELKWTTAFDYVNDNDFDFFIGFIEGPYYQYENIGNPSSAVFQLINKTFLDIDVRGASYPQLVDIDNDGDLDLFTANKYQKIWYFKNIGDKNAPIFQFQTSFYDSITKVTQFYFADIDADDDYDLFTGHDEYGNDISFYRNVGGPDSALFYLEDSAIVTVNGLGGNAPAPVLTDIDNDGDLDLLVSEREVAGEDYNYFNFFRNIGDKYNPVWAYEDDDWFGLYEGVYDVWDYDNDSDYDLIHCTKSEDDIKVYENTGTPESPFFSVSNESTIIETDTLHYGIEPIAMADIYNNNHKDIFLGNWEGGIIIYKNYGPISKIDLYNFNPQNFKLYPNYPNPFNPTTNIKYQLSSICKVELVIYNVLGQKIKTLVNEKQLPGFYTVEFESEGFASGVYFYRLSAAAAKGQKKVFSKIFKMVYLK